MTKKRIPVKLKRLVRQRAKGCCEYCVSPEFCATQLHSTEHITPESRHEHFTWSPDHLYLIGLTPTGRATIRALDLNRKGVVRLRRLLLLDHEHLQNIVHRDAAAWYVLVNRTSTQSSDQPSSPAARESNKLTAP